MENEIAYQGKYLFLYESNDLLLKKETLQIGLNMFKETL